MALVLCIWDMVPYSCKVFPLRQLWSRVKMNSFASVHQELPVCHSEAFDMTCRRAQVESLRLNSAKKPPLCHPERSEGSPRFFAVQPLAGLFRMTSQIVITGWELAHKIRFTLPFQFICCLFLFVSLVSCGKQELKENSTDEVLRAPGFRLVDSPQEIVPWRYSYVNLVFFAPSYRTPQGTPLPGWRFRIIATRRFFTNQSARIYYRIEDVRQSHLFPATNQGGPAKMRIWPVGATLVLETFSGRGAFISDATPVFVDCIRKFQPDASHFPADTLFAGDWCYQRFSADGKTRPMPAGASACHQCHGTALRLTGDLVFTVFSEDSEEK